MIVLIGAKIYLKHTFKPFVLSCTQNTESSRVIIFINTHCFVLINFLDISILRTANVISEMIDSASFLKSISSESQQFAMFIFIDYPIDYHLPKSDTYFYQPKSISYFYQPNLWTLLSFNRKVHNALNRSLKPRLSDKCWDYWSRTRRNCSGRKVDNTQISGNAHELGCFKSLSMIMSVFMYDTFMSTFLSIFREVYAILPSHHS